MTGMNWRERPQNVSFVLLLAHLRSTDEVTPSQPTSSALTVERRTIPTLKIIVPKRRSLQRMERAKTVDDMRPGFLSCGFFIVSFEHDHNFAFVPYVIIYCA